MTSAGSTSDRENPAPAGVEVFRDGAVSWLVLDRPAVLNAIDAGMVAGLAAGLREAADDPTVRAVVIAGNGRAFSSGGDLKAGERMRAEFGPEAPADLFLSPFQALLTQIRELEKPVVAAVHGHCLAGALELVLSCDLVVAASDARFGDPRGPRGLLPALGGPYGLLRAIGTFRAKELLLLGEAWDAERLHAAGLIKGIVDASALRGEAQRLASRFAARPADGTALIKRMLNEEADLDWTSALEREIVHNRRHMSGSEAVGAGLAAFRQRER